LLRSCTLSSRSQPSRFLHFRTSPYTLAGAGALLASAAAQDLTTALKALQPAARAAIAAPLAQALALLADAATARHQRTVFAQPLRVLDALRSTADPAPTTAVALFRKLRQSAALRGGDSAVYQQLEDRCAALGATAASRQVLACIAEAFRVVCEAGSDGGPAKLPLAPLQPHDGLSYGTLVALQVRASSDRECL